MPFRAVSYTHLRAHETRHDLVCRLLLEKRDFTLLSRLHPWDHIPGVFIVRQAGGHDCHFDKLEYKFYNDSNNLIVSNSKKLNYEILNLLEGE